MVDNLFRGSKMLEYWVVDAFTDEPFKGNPAAVFIVKEYPSESIMQNLATEFNLSETVFIKPLASENNYQIRWFTPNSEAPLCGHATVAATHVLKQRGCATDGQKIIYHSHISGELCAEVNNDLITLHFPAFNTKPLTDRTAFLDVINVEPQFVGISENCILIELNTPHDVYKHTPDLEKLTVLPYRALITTSKDHEYDFISRYFAPKVGINEDPVCATAHCRLIPYWHGRLNKTDFTARQASSRGGVLLCKYNNETVLIAGKAVTVMSGRLNLTI